MTHPSPIAVVGMSGVFPGAHDLEIFWKNLVNKKDSAANVPEGRWISPPEVMTNPKPAPDNAYSARACLIDGFVFDSSGLDLSPEVVNGLDPLHQLVLHAGKTALAQCHPEATDKNRIGVCLASIVLPTDGSSRLAREIGGFFLEDALFGSGSAGISGTALFSKKSHSLSARVASFPAVLIAEALGLGGGAFTLDAACASSLYAVKIACDDLFAGRADIMLAGGASRPDALFTQVGFSQLQALSPSGRCAPFDKTADGLVVGEGVGILALKRLDDALRDNDVIHGLIRGIGLSNDIRGNLLAPDSEGQVRAMQKAYAQANWSPADVDYIECHGAGTPLGDQVELASLRRLWEQEGWSKGQCAIGSVKSAIGHLLTAAGAAGIIKTLLGFTHKTLPPSLNFTRPPENSPLIDGPFKVQTQPETWPSRDKQTPRRAAVSAFGFGGINGHILLEEWTGASEYRRDEPALFSIKTGDSQESRVCSKDKPMHEPKPQVAIVGMGTTFGALSSLRDFQEAIFKGETAIRNRPQNRWHGYDETAKRQYGLENLFGNYMEDITVDVSDFHIPPNEIPEILPQQLLMLKVAASAMKNAGLPLRGKRPEMSAIIGIGFDFETTGFNLRWDMVNRVRQWNADHGLNLSESGLEAWRRALMAAAGPPLTAVRTVGDLGSIVASRICREFQFGGPGFSVSSEEASGIKALEIGVGFLQNKETDAVLVGAVDLFGDVRNMVLKNSLRPFSKSNRIRPFDRLADGTLPGEGAAAVVLMRLDDALENGHRVYAVIEGIGKSSGTKKNSGHTAETAYSASLKRAVDDAAVLPETISFIETHGSGAPEEDKTECLALNRFFAPPVAAGPSPACAVGSVKPVIGHCGAAAGLASIIKTALCLYQEIIPPLNDFRQPKTPWNPDHFYIPLFSHYWLKNADDGPRRALSCAMTIDGDCMHTVLAEHDASKRGDGDAGAFAQVRRERKKPLGAMPHGLFVVESQDIGDLVLKLGALSVFIDEFATDSRCMEQIAALWHKTNRPDPAKKLAAALIAGDRFRLHQRIAEAKTAVLQNKPSVAMGQDGVFYSPNPLGPSAKVAFVYPGSGNHYLGMGREIGVFWPDVFREMEKNTGTLKTQMLPHYNVPRQMDYPEGWEKAAYEKIVSDPLIMIFGQVVYGCLMTRITSGFSIRPDAVIGYSLGQSTGYFATGVWQNSEEMLHRMLKTDLFKTGLAGPCLCARLAWNIPPDQDVNWCAAAVNRPAKEVGQVIKKYPFARLLIVNTPEQCVIGGRKSDVDFAIRELCCESVFLDGVVTVHCDAAKPAADEYRALHLFPCTPPKGIRFYSCADGRTHEPSSENAADLILKQAVEGFDFTKTINQAYADGITVFIEMGPHASCTGMIRQILKDLPHLAVSTSFRGENSYLTMLKVLGALIAERMPVDLEAIFGDLDFPPEMVEQAAQPKGTALIVPIGGEKPVFPSPATFASGPALTHAADNTFSESPQREHRFSPEENASLLLSPFSDLITGMREIAQAGAAAHNAFLSLSTDIEKNYTRAFDLQNRLLGFLVASPELPGQLSLPEQDDAAPITDGEPAALFSRNQCLEFAVGSVEKVLGPEFAAVDTYAKRVRLPNEPLMLVDRIISIDGEKCAMGSGRIITEHDVRPGAWYLDGGKAPVCISVEAGQADLFLCSYLGIDQQVKGQRAYRLLDATVEFHRALPEPGDTIRYEIEIDRFVRQGETYLFFFHFKGFIRECLLITMTHGCAGFFTDEEVKNSGGILLDPEQRSSVNGQKDPGIIDLTVFSKNALSDTDLAGLRKGNAAQCFGPEFEGIEIPESLRLPGGRMKLIDRIIGLDPRGGRFGLGLIRAEADIHPDDWFLTCHFQDDMVMPGTLMYECCAHTLRVFVQQMGWITDIPGACYEPKPGVKAMLKCRGPVTPQTQKVHYEVEIKRIGADPEPFVIADAHMFADGRYVVFFQDISLKVSHARMSDICDFWKKQKPPGSESAQAPPVAFSRESLLEFALGKPSRAFGKPYAVFDQSRFIARLPNPPYLLMDRVTRCEPAPWALKPDGWIQSEVDVSPDHWYFAANRSDVMPYAILLEIALQPCGWLAAYMGSALKIDKDLKFRNLGGKAIQEKNVIRGKTVLTTRARLKHVSTVADMIIEEFEFIVSDPNETVFSGDTTFGFFTPDALKRQVGIRDAANRCYVPSEEDIKNALNYAVDAISPRFPDDSDISPDIVFPAHATLPAKALMMIDEIHLFPPESGPSKKGFIQGYKQIDPDEWFFKAHFYQDPVCPGSLGIESFIQLLKFAALKQWKGLTNSHGFEMITGRQHQWTYRGQIVPENRLVEIDAAITAIEEKPTPTIMADGFLKVDGRVIYEMKDYGIRMSVKSENT